MLEVDLQEPDANVADSILGQCAKHGTVASVKIFRAPVPFAIVGMANVEDSTGLADRFGGCSFGSYAILNLEHAPVSRTLDPLHESGARINQAAA
jgi:hypothetical protein